MNNLKEKILEKIDFKTFYRQHLGNLPEPNRDGEVQVRCPFHDDTDPSLSINMTSGFFHCHGCGASGDVFNFYMKKNRLDFGRTLNRMAADLDIKTGNGWGNELTHYDYKNEDGKTIFRIVRFENGKGIPHRPDGNGGWTPGIKDHVDLIPFNLPGLTDQQNNGKTVHITEGEPDAISLLNLGLLSTTNALGASSWKSEYNEYLRGRDVVLYEDNDQAGRDRVAMISASLASIASSIKIIRFTDLPEKSDVTDFLRSLSTPSKIRAKLCLGLQITCTPFWTPETVADAIKITSINTLLSTDFPPQAEIIGNGILPEGCGLLLAGEPKTGKSLMVLEWALNLATGRALFDGLLPVPKPRRVLIFQCENPARQVQYRLRQMIEGMGIANMPDTIFLADRRFRYDLQDEKCVKTMADIVARYEADVMVIDPLSSFHHVSENDNVLMRSVLDQLTYISAITGAASIVVHHFGKFNKDQPEKDRVRGASSIGGWVDSLVTMTHRKHENKILRKIDFKMVRNGPEPKPIIIERGKDFLSTVTEAEMMITPKQIQDILNKDFGGTANTKSALVKALENVFECSDSTAKRAIKEAEEMGCIRGIPGKGKSKQYIML